MFERFSSSARQVVVLAQQSARGLQHAYVDDFDILNGVVLFLSPMNREGGLHNVVLSDAVVHHHLDNLQLIEELTTRLYPPVSTDTGHIPFTPTAKRILEKAYVLAISSTAKVVTPRLLLIATLEFDEGSPLSEIMEALGTNVVDLLDDLTKRAADLADAQFVRDEDLLGAWKKWSQTVLTWPKVEEVAQFLAWCDEQWPGSTVKPESIQPMYTMARDFLRINRR